jgi:hypothetical protein
MQLILLANNQSNISFYPANLKPLKKFCVEFIMECHTTDRT